VNRAKATAGLKNISPRVLSEMPFVKAYNTRVKTIFRRDWFFDSIWSFKRGYRFNFKETWPVLYLACDKITATVEIGPRTREDLLVPHLSGAEDPFLYVDVKATAPVLDLTERGVRRRLGVTLAEITVPTEVWDEEMDSGIRAVTHDLGQLVLENGRFGGILFPSFPARRFLKMKQKECLAVFMDVNHPAMAVPRGPATRLEVVDAGGILGSLGLKH